MKWIIIYLYGNMVIVFCIGGFIRLKNVGFFLGLNWFLL